MLVARGKAGRVSGLLERLPADQKRVHQNDPIAEADAAAPRSDTTTSDPAADVTAALDVTPLLEPTAPPMPAVLAAPAGGSIFHDTEEPDALGSAPRRPRR